MDDLISRRHAIEVINAVLAVTGDKNVAKVWDQIKDLPSAQPEQRWIPVTEKLPKKSGYYLVTIDIGLKIVGIIYFNNASGFLMANKVTAWKPRPEPYREENR